MTIDKVAYAWSQGDYIASTVILRRSSLGPLELWKLLKETQFMSPPVFFKKTGESFEYCLAVEGFLLCIRDMVLENNTKKELVNHLFALVSAKLNLRLTLFSSFDLSVINKSRAIIIEEYCGINGLFTSTFQSSNDPKAALIVNSLSDNLETTSALSQLFALPDAYKKYICFYQEAGNLLDRSLIPSGVSLIHLTGDCPEDIKYLRGLGIRVAIYGCDLTCFIRPITVLAASRVAAIQVANMATACSTMLANIDKFIMGSEYKPSRAYELYSEDITESIGLGYRGIESDRISDRNMLCTSKERNLSSRSEVVLATGSNVYKTTPEALDLWLKILSQNTVSRLHIAPFNRKLTPQNESSFIGFIQDRATHYEIDPLRIRVFKLNGTRAEFLRYLASSDLLLDSPLFSSGNATLDSFQVCTPIISLEGNSFRSRLSAGSQKIFGKKNMICRSEQDFVEMVHQLCDNKEALISEMHQCLALYDQRVVTGFENMPPISM